MRFWSSYKGTCYLLNRAFAFFFHQRKLGTRHEALAIRFLVAAVAFDKLTLIS